MHMEVIDLEPEQPDLMEQRQLVALLVEDLLTTDVSVLYPEPPLPKSSAPAQPAVFANTPDGTRATGAVKTSLEEAKRLVKPLVLERIDVGSASNLAHAQLVRELNGSDLLLVFPDKVRMALKTPMGEMTTVLDGKTGFRQAGGRVMDLSAGDVEDASEELARDLAWIVVRGGTGVEAVAAGQEEIGGVAYRILALSAGGVETRLWIAPDGLVFKQAYQGKHPMQRTPGKTEVLYSDYREIEGLHLPHVQVMRFEGQEIMRTILESVEVNPEVDSGAFAKPAA